MSLYELHGQPTITISQYLTPSRWHCHAARSAAHPFQSARAASRAAAVAPGALRDRPWVAAARWQLPGDTAPWRSRGHWLLPSPGPAMKAMKRQKKWDLKGSNIWIVWKDYDVLIYVDFQFLDGTSLNGDWLSRKNEKWLGRDGGSYSAIMRAGQKVWGEVDGLLQVKWRVFHLRGWKWLVSFRGRFGCACYEGAEGDGSWRNNKPHIFLYLGPSLPVCR